MPVDETHQAEQRRFMRLSLLPLNQLRAEERRVMRRHNLTRVMGGPKTRSEIAQYIVMIEREARVRAEHHAQHGDGHESCGTMNGRFLCDKGEQ